MDLLSYENANVYTEYLFMDFLLSSVSLPGNFWRWKFKEKLERSNQSLGLTKDPFFKTPLPF